MTVHNVFCPYQAILYIKATWCPSVCGDKNRAGQGEGRAGPGGAGQGGQLKVSKKN